jgi:hypothetical protein
MRSPSLLDQTPSLQMSRLEVIGVLLLTLTLCCCPLMTLSHLELQWGELCSEATFGTDMCIAGSNVIVASPAASGGQPLVLTISEAVNPDLAPVCQVGEEEHAGRAGAASLLFVKFWLWSCALYVEVHMSAVDTLSLCYTLKSGKERTGSRGFWIQDMC